MFSTAVYAQPADPTALVVLGVSRTEHSLAWQDNSTDETQYRIERSTNGGPWTEIGTIGPQQGYPRHRITGANPTDRYLYRIRAYRASDNTFSNYSNTYAAPLWVERPNVRVFFNTTDCPSAIPGRVNCVPNTTNPAGENEMAARAADVIEGAHTEYRAFNFRDPSIPAGADREPVNLVWADGGGESGNDGVRLAPDFMGAYNHSTNTGDASSFIIPVHEYLHSIQYAYKRPKQDPAGAWMGEGQARAIQDLICVPIGSDPCVNVDDDTSGAANYWGEVNGYLGDPNRPVTEISYAAALFWTYLCQEYGTNAGEPRRGLDFIRRFLDEGDINDQRDGIQVMDATLAAVGSTDDFEDAFKKFVVANYAKDLTGANVPAHYRYADEQQPPTPPFHSVRLDLDQALTPSDQIGPLLGDVQRWGARYYKIRPDAAVSSIQVDFSVDSAYQAYFTLLAVKNDDIISEFNHTGKSFSRTLVNNAYDEVMVTVAGLSHAVNFRYAVNATTPVLRILDPLATRPVDVGSHTSPEKFLVKLEVLSASAAPVSGIPFGDFSFTVGTQQVSAANIVTKAYLQGQYWFVLQAPGQSADGLYDLSVDWSTQTDTASSAVNYTARSDTDNVMVIDRSGSMNFPAPPATPKIVDAQKAAKLYVDSWRTGDKIGVVSFAGSASADLTLRDWTETSRTAAHTAIDDLTAGGLTSIGAGLAEGLAELDDRGAAAHTWALILLSDGLNTTGADIDDFLGDYKTRQDAGEQVPEVHTVAIGADANRPDLQKLADRTGGSYHFVSEPESGGGAAILSAVTPTIFWQNLSEIFRVVGERIIRESQVLAERGKTTQSATIVHPFPVDAGASELVAVVSYRFGEPVIGLRDPNGTLQALFAQVDNEHAVYRIASPLAGVWQVELSVSNNCQEFCTSDYLAEASVKSELTMALYLGLSEAERIEGTPMPILVALTESGPVPNAAVAAKVTLPSGEKQSLTLLDDGSHQDGAADDGIYGNTLWTAAEPGSYQLVVQASGSTEAGGPFVRRLIESFHLRKDKNADNDCLPDGYEQRMGLNTSEDDGGEDPDGDGLDNCRELEEGTDPFDPDTDDGGESDGSELDGGRDVHQPDDDLLSEPRIFAYPGVGRVFVYFSKPPNVVAFDIFRAADSDPGSSAPPPPEEFALLAASQPAADPYHFIDENVTNGTRYWYYLVSLGSGGNSSGPSDAVAATPRTDPYAPHGTVIINAGGPCTNSTDVMLTLFASDEWDPESLYIDPRGYDPQAEISQVADMMISNSSDFEGASWEPYTQQHNWLLNPDPSGFATVYVRFRDHAGNVSDIFHHSTFIDQEPPAINFNAQETITPPDAPISFTATATDGFGDAPYVEITGYDCFFFTKRGKRIDKKESCAVNITNSTITIMDLGGVDTHITWTGRATDSCGNVTEGSFETLVVNPAE